MPISKTRYNLVLDELEKHGLEVDRDRLPLPDKSHIGREHEFELDFLDELIEQNVEYGFTLDSTHAYEDPDDDLYLTILENMLEIGGFTRERIEGGNSVDDSGIATVWVKIDGDEFSWRGDTTEEYIDTDVVDSMMETLSRYSDKELYLAGYGEETYCIFACPGKVAQLMRDMYVAEAEEEEDETEAAAPDAGEEISHGEFYGDRRGSYLSDEGRDAGRAAIALIDANDLPAFETSLEAIGRYVCAYEIVDEIFNHLVLPAVLFNSKDTPDLSHTEPFFECLLDRFAFHLLADAQLQFNLPMMADAATKNPPVYCFIEIMLAAAGGAEAISISLEETIRGVARSGNLDLLSRFLEIESNKATRQDFDQVLYSATRAATASAQIESLKCLLPYWSPKLIADQSGRVLSEAAGAGDRQLIDLLLDAGFEFDTEDNFLYEKAMESGNHETIAFLFEKGMRLPERDRKISSTLQSLVASSALRGRWNSKAIVDSMAAQDPDFWQRVGDLSNVVDAGITFAGGAWAACSTDDDNERKWGETHLGLVHELLDRYLEDCEKAGDEGREKLQKLLFTACEATMPCVVEKLLRYGLDLDAPGDRGKTPVESADHEARVYILGSRSGSADIYKINALRILLMFDADLSEFPQEWIDKARNFAPPS